jgi:hypothetical protein
VPVQGVVWVRGRSGNQDDLVRLMMSKANIPQGSLAAPFDTPNLMVCVQRCCNAVLESGHGEDGLEKELLDETAGTLGTWSWVMATRRVHIDRYLVAPLE